MSIGTLGPLASSRKAGFWIRYTPRYALVEDNPREIEHAATSGPGAQYSHPARDETGGPILVQDDILPRLGLVRVRGEDTYTVFQYAIDHIRPELAFAIRRCLEELGFAPDDRLVLSNLDTRRESTVTCREFQRLIDMKQWEAALCLEVLQRRCPEAL